MNPRVIVNRWDELPLDKVTEMVSRKVVTSDAAKLTQAYYKKGAIVPIHVHPADIIVHVLQGALRLTVDGDDLTVREGDVVVIPAASRHQAESLDDTFLLTVSHDPV
jgi:quercetin dioxygenase-like cupin family protein